MSRKFDLEDRTVRFGEDIIKLCRKVNKDIITLPIINQLIRSGTSVGSNYHEADCAESKRDFEHKIGICKKESKETRYWLRMLITALPNLEYNTIIETLLEISN